MSWLIFIEQNLGPHMLQKWAVLWASLGRVSSWYLRAVSGSRSRLNGSAERAGVGDGGGSLPIRAFSLAPPVGADQVFANGQASTQSRNLGRDVVTVVGIKAGEVHGLVGP